MDPLFYTVNLLALGVCLVMATVVLGTNYHRRSNRAFAVFSAVIALWLLCRMRVINASDPEVLTFWIRQAFACALFIPASANLLRLAIKCPEVRMREHVKPALSWFLAALVLALLCQTPFVVQQVGFSSTGTPQPQFFLPGFIACMAFFAVAVVGLPLTFIRDLRSSSGLQRLELQFMVLGYGLGFGFGVLTTMLLPYLDATGEARKFAPLAVVILNSCVAYGIATRRIMHVTSVLRWCAVYILLGAFMIVLYLGSLWITAGLVDFLELRHHAVLPHLLAMLVVGFSINPAMSLVRQAVGRLLADREEVDVQQTVRQANALLQSITTLDELLTQFTAVVQRSVGTNEIRILLRQGEQFDEVFQIGTIDGELSLTGETALVQQLRQVPLPVVRDGLRRQSPTTERREMLSWFNDHEVQVAAGIYARKKLQGVMLLGPRSNGRVYSLTEQEALSGTCNQLAIALENARLYTEVQDSKVYNETLLENMVSAVVSVDRDARINTCNREAERLLGLSASDVEGQLIELLPPPLREACKEALSSGLARRNHELELESPEGDRQLIRLDTTLIHSHESEQLGVMLMFQDVTVIKQMENQIRRSDRLASIGTLSAGMAHEIKNPLVSLKTFTQLLPERYDDRDFRETFTSLIGDEVDRIDRIVNHVLEFARPAKPKLAPMSLNNVISNSASLLGQKLRDENIEVSLDLHEGGDTILGDNGQIGQIIVNLALNAAEAMPGGGRLRIATFPSLPGPFTDEGEGGAITCMVQDSGSGIAPELLSRVFDPFFTTKDSGTGLGLSVVHGILEEHGAKMDVESNPAEGTRFLLQFRLITASSAAGHPTQKGVSP